MGVKLTKRVVDSAMPGERDAFLWDTDLKGFILKVTPKGRKVFLVERRVGAGRAAKLRRVTIGTYGIFTVDQARGKAEEILRALKAGSDPVAERRAAEVQASVAALNTKREKERAFSVLAARYISRRVEGKMKTSQIVRSAINRHFAESWKDRDIATITRQDVSAILESIVDLGHPQMANKALAVIRPLFAYAQELGLINSNPAAGLRTGCAVVQRERTLSNAELAEIWEAAGRMGYPFGPMVQLLILTGQRRNEVAAMRWVELDLDAALWTIPRERAKNGKAHLVHLSPLALEILTNMEQPGDFVLTTTERTGVSGFSRAKGRLDDLIMTVRAQRTSGNEPVPIMPEWTIHDLRRTFATGCAAMGVQPHIVEKILNHVPKALSGVAGIYNRFDYLPERKLALDAWGRHVEALARGWQETMGLRRC